MFVLSWDLAELQCATASSIVVNNSEHMGHRYCCCWCSMCVLPWDPAELQCSTASSIVVTNSEHTGHRYITFVVRTLACAVVGATSAASSWLGSMLLTSSRTPRAGEGSFAVAPSGCTFDEAACIAVGRGGGRSLVVRGAFVSVSGGTSCVLQEHGPIGSVSKRGSLGGIRTDCGRTGTVSKSGSLSCCAAFADCDTDVVGILDVAASVDWVVFVMNCGDGGGGVAL